MPSFNTYSEAKRFADGHQPNVSNLNRSKDAELMQKLPSHLPSFAFCSLARCSTLKYLWQS